MNVASLIYLQLHTRLRTSFVRLRVRLFCLRLSYLALAFTTLNQGPCAASDSAADFYVSPDGSDAWTGTLAEPNASRSDGPFASLARARDAIRMSGKNRYNDTLVLVRGGTYPLTETVVFGVEDSGHGNWVATYAAFPGETPIFTAGRIIQGWKTCEEAGLGLPENAIGKVQVADIAGEFETPFKALFDARGLLTRARSKGFIPPRNGSRTEVHLPVEVVQRLKTVNDLEIAVRPHHAWILNILPVEHFNAQRRTATTEVPATYAMKYLHFLRETDSCWIENAIEHLDAPGEWVLDSVQGKLYLWPRNTSPIVAPLLTELVRIEGEIDEQGPIDVPVRNLCFRGLTFLHGDRYTITSDDAGLQHDWDMHDKANAIVRLRGTENCRIEGCRFAHSGSSAIRVDLHGQRNTIASNVIEQMGGAGILLCGYGPGTKDVNHHNTVQNNHIHHMGQIYSHSPGIMIWQSGENQIAHNLIHHTPYTAVILSGCMADFFRRQGRELSKTIRRHELSGLPQRPTRANVLRYLHTHGNNIEYNEIHHAMEKLADGNAIYIRGAGSGNVIRRNYIHDLIAPTKMQAAIRTDGGQTDTLIAENLIRNCAAQGIILKLNNRCENNIIANVIAPPRGYYLSVREGPMIGATIRRNIFYSSSTDCTFIDELPAGKGRTSEDRRGRTLARSKQADTDYNIYFCAADPEIGRQMLLRQQRDNTDHHSLAVDPLFVAPENGDFRLKPNSPASQIGFQPIDLSKIGLIQGNSEASQP
ncbi:MAG: right-handed parallel beta-helix repeat-containing protein [Aureliella sp.]